MGSVGATQLGQLRGVPGPGRGPCKDWPVPRPKRVPRALPAPIGQSRSSVEQASNYLKQLIFEGELERNSRVPQDDVADALGLSRLPVREAVLILEREGWVTVIPKRGAYVAAFTPEWVRDHYELLGFVYGLAARRAVELDPPQLVERLREIEREIASTKDIEHFRRSANRFQATVIEASHSLRIKSVLRSIAPIVQGNFFVEVPGAVSVERRGAVAIRRAIARKDSVGAAAAYRKMLGEQADMVVELFRRRGLLDTTEGEDRSVS